VPWDRRLSTGWHAVSSVVVRENVARFPSIYNEPRV
jgi:hypothetical protein